MMTTTTTTTRSPQSRPNRSPTPTASPTPTLTLFNPERFLLPRSRARDAQLEADDRDIQLTRLARLRHPRVMHWWGRRSTPSGAGAYCYLCDCFIATWSSRWPMTANAKHEIALDRLTHIRRQLDGRHTRPEEKAQ